MRRIPRKSVPSHNRTSTLSLIVVGSAPKSGLRPPAPEYRDTFSGEAVSSENNTQLLMAANAPSAT
jgi:hypothetical protein